MFLLFLLPADFLAAVFLLIFFEADFFAVVFLDARFVEVFLAAVFFFGTLSPSRRASLMAMAIACFLLFTFVRPPDFNFPLPYSCITLLTFFCAFFEYFAIMSSLKFNVAGVKNMPSLFFI